MAGGGGNKKRRQYCTDSSGQEIRNFIDPSFLDNLSIPSNLFEYIYHMGCAVSLHSITNSG